MENGFIIRVYGIYIDPSLGVLVSDECIKGRNITKFPGGGLEYGEGTIECLQREMLEETGSDFEIVSHFYTTDHFVESAFHPGQQVISIYYSVKPVETLKIETATRPFDFKDPKEGCQSFRYISMQNLVERDFTLPIDRHVGALLVEGHR